MIKSIPSESAEVKKLKILDFKLDFLTFPDQD